MGIVDEFFELKDSTDADLLAMQVGDFYEFFSDDARVVSKELGLKISEKSSHGSSYAMAGVPIDDLEQYVKTLVESKGYTVAVADQYEENGEHKRKIVRKVTPGTILETVEEGSRYLASVFISDSGIGLSFTDVSSGHVLVKDTTREDYLDLISVYNPVEILISSDDACINEVEDIKDEIDNYINSRIEIINKKQSISKSKERIEEQFGGGILESVGLNTNTLSVISANILLNYLDCSIPEVKRSITRLREVGDEDHINMDARTRKCLEIVDTINSEAGQSLFDVIDKTYTSNGRDELRRCLQRPLSTKSKIESRQDSVESLVNSGLQRQEIVNTLENFPNLPRIASRASYGSARPREISRIVSGLDSFDELEEIFKRDKNLRNSPLFEKFKQLDYGEVSELRDEIKSALVEDPPNSIDKGLISRGYDAELDEIIEKHEANKSWFEELERDFKSEYGLTHVTVDRNKTDGFYIQVGKSESEEVPRDKFDKIKTLKNSERFKNSEIREREREYLRYEEQREEKEKEVYEDLLDVISNHSSLLQDIGEVVAHIDCLLSFALHAVENRWVKPEILENRKINIQDGRHPVVEQDVDFVPNDTVLKTGQDFCIVTGPNMSGKSTYLRQTALIVLLSQVGSYVPASRAEIGIVDGIFTRVGAMDEISRGRSTFMVEMAELANILHSSTDESLVILDEVGRGTATYDGISIAKSTIEYLAKSNDAQSPLTMFATHYHELTSMADNYTNVFNVNVAVKSDGDEYEFVRKVRKGAADKSYGIKVAEIAGVPQPVIERSQDILDNLRKDENN